MVLKDTWRSGSCTLPASTDEATAKSVVIHRVAAELKERGAYDIRVEDGRISFKGGVFTPGFKTRPPTLVEGEVSVEAREGVPVLAYRVNYGRTWRLGILLSSVALLLLLIWLLYLAWQLVFVWLGFAALFGGVLTVDILLSFSSVAQFFSFAAMGPRDHPAS